MQTTLYISASIQLDLKTLTVSRNHFKNQPYVMFSCFFLLDIIIIPTSAIFHYLIFWADLHSYDVALIWVGIYFVHTCESIHLFQV